MGIFHKFPTISKLNFWLVICIAKNFIWTTLKAIFSVFLLNFLHPQIPDFQIVVQILSYPNKPYINGKLSYSAFRWCINLNFKKIDWFCGPGSHLCNLSHLNFNTNINSIKIFLNKYICLLVRMSINLFIPVCSCLECGWTYSSPSLGYFHLWLGVKCVLQHQEQPSVLEVCVWGGWEWCEIHNLSCFSQCFTNHWQARASE